QESLFQEVLDTIKAPLKNVRIPLPIQSTSPHEPSQKIWQKLRAKYPAPFAVSSEALVAWREREAAASGQAGQWFAARFHLDKLLEATPGDEPLRKRRDEAEGLLRRAAIMSETAPATKD